MATSGTTTFESGFFIDDIITEAYERIGRFDYSGNDIKTATFFKHNVSRMGQQRSAFLGSKK